MSRFLGTLYAFYLIPIFTHSLKTIMQYSSQPSYFMEEETKIQKTNSLGKNIRCRNQHLKPKSPFLMPQLRCRVPERQLDRKNSPLNSGDKEEFYIYLRIQQIRGLCRELLLKYEELILSKCWVKLPLRNSTGEQACCAPCLMQSCFYFAWLKLPAGSPWSVGIDCSLMRIMRLVGDSFSQERDSSVNIP